MLTCRGQAITIIRFVPDAVFVRFEGFNKGTTGYVLEDELEGYVQPRLAGHVCTCGTTRGGYRRDDELELVIHAECGRPTASELDKAAAAAGGPVW